MGFDTAATHAIWVIAIASMLGIVMGAGFDVVEGGLEGAERGHEASTERLAGKLDRSYSTFDADTGTLTVSVRNVGRVPLNASTVTLVLDGEPVTSYSVSVEGTGGSDRWLPDETAVFTVTGESGIPERVIVVTEHGLIGVTSSTTTYAYASSTLTDVAGGTVTNAAALTAADDDAVATFDETRTTTAMTVPETQNERDFETAPLTGWSATPVTGTFSLAQLDTEGTPTATGAMALTKTDGSPGSAYVAHSWTRTAADTAADASFTMNYQFTGGSNANRYADVHLVKPDASTIQIGTRATSAGAGVWSTFGPVAVAASHLSQSGTYSIRITVGLQGSSDGFRVDNVALTWTDYTPYRFGKQLEVTGVTTDAGATNSLQVRYRVTSGSEGLELWTEGPSGTWTLRATLTETATAQYTHPLSASEVLAGGVVNLRLVDATKSGDLTADRWEVDYVRVKSVT